MQQLLYLFAAQDIQKLQDEAWSDAKEIWGADRYGVMNFLQTEWEKTEFTVSVDYTEQNFSETAKSVLEVSQ